MLQLNNISKTYNQNSILDGVSLDLGVGCYGIVGNNGCGKSTLLNIIAGSVVADFGEVSHDNVNITQSSSLDRALFGFGKMFQEDGFVPDLSVYDNLKLILLGPITNWRELWKVGIQSNFDKSQNLQIQKQIEQTLSKFQLREHSLTLAKDLSGGQKKLLQFARLELRQSKLWLLDEPLAGVSLQNKPIFEQIILDAKSTKTIILVEHNLEFVRRVADHIFELIDGKLNKID
jgi:ABC-type branched-subunit amino acid transport system ATPase component